MLLNGYATKMDQIDHCDMLLNREEMSIVMTLDLYAPDDDRLYNGAQKITTMMNNRKFTTRSLQSFEEPTSNQPTTMQNCKIGKEREMNG